MKTSRTASAVYVSGLASFLALRRRPVRRSQPGRPVEPELETSALPSARRSGKSVAAGR